MLPFFQWGWAERLNRYLILRHLQAALRTFAPGKTPILVSTLPIVPFLFRSPLFARKVYYCVDDFTTWHGVSGTVMRRLEDALLPDCDLVIATSSQLLKERGPRAPRASLLTHGVDAGHFQAAGGGTGRRTEFPSGPVLGLFGAFDQRIEGDILRALARRWPEGSIEVIGPVDRDLGEFAGFPNIRFRGSVPYRDLPRHVARFDVCLLPYKVDESTLRINPLKLKEYLATGKPVVSTPLPEAEKLSRYLTLAPAENFADAVAEVLRPDWLPPEGLQDFLASESWDFKAEAFCRTLLEGM